jgi:spore coat protein U domain-containing protein, fimbrial subunit CupE1/2/3/6
MRGDIRFGPATAACVLFLAVPTARSANCSISTSGLNFGTYDVFSSLDDNITATIIVNCMKKKPYSISLSSGSGTFGSRTLTSTVGTLAYNLFLDPTHLSIWGDGSSGTSTITGTGTGSNVNTPVYGRIPAGQNVAVGTYSDLITVTVTF